MHNTVCDILGRLMRDNLGRIHGPLPTRADTRALSLDELRTAQSELRASIAAREANMARFGQDPGHLHRLNEERSLLSYVNRRLGGP